MTALVQYEAACAALAAAVKADEVMRVHLEAKAIEAVARVAKNFDLEIDAVKLRTRAEVRLGDMLREAIRSGIVAPPGRPHSARAAQDQRPATLTEIGVDRKLSARAKRLSSVGLSEIESLLVRMERESRARGRVAINVLNAEAAKQTARYKRPTRGRREAQRFPTALTGDARDWSLLYLRKVARLLAAIGDHCGAADEGEIVRDLVSDEVIAKLARSVGL